MTTAEGVQTWLDGFGDAPFDYEIRDLEVAACGDTAFAQTFKAAVDLQP
jgi:hypothetical protein